MTTLPVMLPHEKRPVLQLNLGHYLCRDFFITLVQAVPEFAYAIVLEEETMQVGTNAYIWWRFISNIKNPCWMTKAILFRLLEIWPVFFEPLAYLTHEDPRIVWRENDQGS